MRVSFPILEDRGMASGVYDHFGSAPMFLLIDVVTDEIAGVITAEPNQEHRGGSAVAALAAHDVTAVIVGGIGHGALSKLHNAGIRVFKAQNGSVAENLRLLKDRALTEFVPGEPCETHRGGGCSH